MQRTRWRAPEKIKVFFKNQKHECEMQRTRGRAPEKIKVFFKNQKHEPNIVEITHLCIRHGVHISMNDTNEVPCKVRWRVMLCLTTYRK
jgi:hypothetical protein